jgi:hypothetical protein
VRGQRAAARRLSCLRGTVKRQCVKECCSLCAAGANRHHAAARTFLGIGRKLTFGNAFSECEAYKNKQSGRQFVGRFNRRPRVQTMTAWLNSEYRAPRQSTLGPRGRFRRASAPVIAFLCGAGFIAVLHLPTACGAEFAAAEAEQSKISTPLYGGNASLGKISSNLLEFRQPARRRVSAGQALQQIEIAPLLPGHDGLLDIEVRFRALTPDIAARVQATGMQVTDIQYRFARIYGLCDPQLLDEIAAIPEVTTVHPNYRPQRNSGSVYDQADASVNADLARLSFGVDGSGIGVGVLSDSFNDTLGGSVSGTGYPISRFHGRGHRQTQGLRSRCHTG